MFASSGKITLAGVYLHGYFFKEILNKYARNVEKHRFSPGNPDRYKGVKSQLGCHVILIGVTKSKQGECDVDTQKVTLSTEKGNIELELYPEKMPITVENFLKLVDSGFYDGLTFHRVEHWVVQGGDPRGNGTGGPGWTIKLETHHDLKNVRGALAMARSAHPDSAGSQFYILKTDAPWLDGQYAVFGMVTSGMDVVDKLEMGDRINKAGHS